MTAYDRWKTSHGDLQGMLEAQEDERWQLARENAAGALRDGLSSDEAVMISESVDEFISDTMDESHFEQLNKLLIDIAMKRPFDSSSALIEDVRDLIQEKLEVKYFKEFDE